MFVSQFLFACSKKDADYEYASRDGGGSWSYKGDFGYDVAPGEYESGLSTGDSGEGLEGKEEPTNNDKPKAGQLTVCAYNDNDNWAFIQSLLARGQEGDGLFQAYQEQYKLINNRISLKIKNGNNVKVELLDDALPLSKREFTMYYAQVRVIEYSV